MIIETYLIVGLIVGFIGMLGFFNPDAINSRDIINIITEEQKYCKDFSSMVDRNTDIVFIDGVSINAVFTELNDRIMLSITCQTFEQLPKYNFEDIYVLKHNKTYNVHLESLVENTDNHYINIYYKKI